MNLSTIPTFKIRIRSALLAIFLIGSLTASAQLTLGDPAPEIRLPDSLGKWTTLSELKATYIVIDFWASWCPPCKIVATALKKIKEENPTASFEILAVSLDRDYWSWVRMARSMELPFIHVNDAYGLKSPLCNLYGVTRIPTKFLIKNGKIIAIGPSLSDISEAIKKE